MLREPATKYRPFAPVPLPDRTWPSRVLQAPPLWCSVDLRDGNQALIEPMNGPRKLALFDQLLRIGFKEIEVGFPAASQIEHDFVRRLIEEDRIPQDVTVQVLTQARADLIARTFESLRGARRAIVHLYNSTSTTQRRVVFKLDRDGIIDMAVKGAELIRAHAQAQPDTEWVMQYSPESFTGTELDFAVEICNAVTSVWSPSAEHPVILNLPATVEMATPNVYADQIEWFCRHVAHRDSVIVSVHPHNDRGTAVAAAELALLAGAQRVEGTLFGNGERTGNVDLVTLALNLYTQGVDPGLDFSGINAIARCVESCTQLPIHPRHPYVGDLVFTAFSGSHQDAIKKGLAALDEAGIWDVPYLPIDPADLGRSYESIIRVNSQSGKGGIAYLLERDYQVVLPRRLLIELSRAVQAVADSTGKELGSDELWKIFAAEYLDANGPLSYHSHQLKTAGDGSEREALTLRLTEDGAPLALHGSGTGPLDAAVHALGLPIEIAGYDEHACGSGSDASAITYLELAVPDGRTFFGVGKHSNIITASLLALISGINRALRVNALERRFRAVT